MSNEFGVAKKERKMYLIEQRESALDEQLTRLVATRNDLNAFVDTCVGLTPTGETSPEKACEENTIDGKLSSDTLKLTTIINEMDEQLSRL